MYLVLSAFTSSLILLLETTKASVVFFIVCTLPTTISRIESAYRKMFGMYINYILEEDSNLLEVISSWYVFTCV